MRAKIFEAHLKASPEILKKQIESVLDVRQAWQQVDKPSLDKSPEPVPSVQSLQPAMAASGDEVASMNWTA